MLETKNKTINGTTYKVTQLGVRKGTQVLLRIVNKLGLLAKAEGGGVEGIIGAVAQNLTEEDFNFLCDAFLPMTLVSTLGKEIPLKNHFELHFAGKYWEMCEWLAFCLEVNFSDFLDGLKSKIGELGSQPRV